MNELATVYHAIGQPRRALELYEQTLPIMREVGDRAGEATMLNNMSALYFAKGQIDRTLQMLEQVLAVMREVNSLANEATVLTNMAVALWQANRHSEAAQKMQEAVAVVQKHGLTHAADGMALEQAQQVTAQMRNGTFGASQATSPALSTLPAEQLQTIVANTVAVLTTVKEKHGEWRKAIEGALGQARQQGEEWRSEVEFFAAILAQLDGGSPSLPAGQPYAEAVEEIRGGMRRGKTSSG